ncbi:YoaK family protein [Micromonospora sp. WMMD987]|uniref:YoaK family protein n=1 Tax=Micromonospora sp. WMMD987 TaxID=3016089 RepID=UPI00249B8A02|nr:YoaK family protein [Micromonospora sp. WMMD987]WFE97211.1 YoaK family protein [Micromonospora sp. WMMD987]
MTKRYELPLLVLTAATGAVDGVSYLALDRVFTGNMTGNVLFIGFGLAGVSGLPVLNNLVALLAFMLGAVLAARLTRGAPGPAKLPAAGLAILVGGSVLSLALAGVWLGSGPPSHGAMLVTTALLALVLGAQAAAVKHIGIRDLSTVVVTMTMVNLSADSRAAGGPGTAWLRRFGAITAMGLGAFVAAVLTLRVNGAVALLVAGVLLALGTTLIAVIRHREVAAATPTDDGPATGGH